jgi:transposase
MKYFVGIDIAKNIHYACITDSNGVVLSEPFPFENNISGFKFLLSHIKHLDKKAIIFGMESTVHYSNNLSNYLLSNSYRVGIINPIQTHALRKTRIRDAKNDKIDSLIVCRALALDLHTKVSLNDTLTELKDLCRSYDNIKTMRSRTKIQYVTYLDQSFPELAKYFKGNPHINTAYQLLKKYPLPSKINKVRVDSLAKLLHKASHGRYSKDKAIELKQLCLTTVGIQRDSIGFQIQQAIEQIELYSKQLEEIKDKISQIVLSLNSHIMTIPGMGIIQAAIILSSIKDITLFSSPSKVLAYAGLDPRLYQSGNFKASTTRMSKRGSGMLRGPYIFSS